MKRLMISTAILAAAGSAALAQEAAFRTTADPLEIHASEFIGKRVYASEGAIENDTSDGMQDSWSDIGEINDIVLSRTGEVEAVMVDIGGFLGIGEREVAVDMGAIRFVADSATPEDESDYFLVMNGTRATFENAPEYSWPMATMQKAGDAADAAATEAGQAIDNAATSVKKAADDAAAAVGDAATTTGEAVTNAVDNTSVSMTRDHVMRDGYEPATETDMTTEMLTGAKAYDANDEWIGEVSELVVDGQGKLTDAVVDVGGFLGIGEKPVKLPLSDIDILRETGGDDMRVYIPMTKEQLEELPTYEE